MSKPWILFSYSAAIQFAVTSSNYHITKGDIEAKLYLLECWPNYVLREMKTLSLRGPKIST
jgi:hypothetical protein